MEAAHMWWRIAGRALLAACSWRIVSTMGSSSHAQKLMEAAVCHRATSHHPPFVTTHTPSHTPRPQASAGAAVAGRPLRTRPYGESWFCTYGSPRQHTHTHTPAGAHPKNQGAGAWKVYLGPQ